MARFRDSISSFLFGEISPKLWGRTELEQYKQSCETLENMIVYPQGGAGRRPGSQFYAGLFKDASGNVVDLTAARCIPFVISETQKYLIVIRMTDADFDASTGQMGMLVYDVSSFTPTLTYLQSLPVQRFVPYNTTDYPRQFLYYSTKQQLDEIQFAQYGNAIFFAQKDRPPIALQYNPAAFGGDGFYLYEHWAFSYLIDSYVNDTDLARGFPFDTRNTSTRTMAISNAAVGTGRTMTYSSVNGIFTERDVGRVIRTTNAGNTQTGVAIITATAGTVASPSTTATCTVLVAFADTVATTNWAFSSWTRMGYSNSLGYPGSVCFYQGRLMYGGSYGYPTSVWGSYSTNLSKLYELRFAQDGSATVVNTDAFRFDLASIDPSIIKWMNPGKTILIGTGQREYQAYAADQSVTTGFGPLNYTFSPDSSLGSSFPQPIRRNNAVYFVQRSGRKLEEFLYNFQEDSFKGNDVLMFAEHMVRRTQSLLSTYTLGTIVQLAQQNTDINTIWCLDSNGGVFSMTRDKDLGIAAFSYHKMGGVLSTNPAKVLSICTVPSPDNSYDDLWMLVRRTVNGTDVTFLEKIGREFEIDGIFNSSTSIADKPIFCDGAILKIQASSTSFTGFDHLKNMVVDVVADGKWVGQKTVSSGGVITLTDAATEVIAGLNYRSIIKTTNINMGSVIGSSQGTPKSVDTVTIRFNRTVGAKFGDDLTRLQEIDFKDPTAPQDDEIQLFTGDKELAFREGWSNKLHVILVQDLPLPFQVDCIIARGLLND
jgi:hypothetical protein